MILDKEKNTKNYTYSTDSCPSCVKNAIDAELKAMGKVESQEELSEITRWENKHRYLKAAALVVLGAILYFLYSMQSG